MRKSLFILLFILTSFISKGQIMDYPQGNARAEYYHLGALGAVLGFEFRSTFTDTTQANTYLSGVLKNRAGFMIRCVNDIFIRSNDLQSWIKVNGGGGTPSLTQYRLAVGDASNLLSSNAAITGNKALASDINGVPVASSRTDTALGDVSGDTRSVQTQLTAKESKATISD